MTRPGLNDHVLALVTGAAHRIGRIFALTLARRGYDIVVHYHHSHDRAEQTADEIRAQGVRAFAVQADLSNEEGISALLEALDSSLDSSGSKLAVLINSAGIMKRGRLQTCTPADWDYTFALNLKAPFLLARSSAERLMDGGMIVNVTDAGAGKPWTAFPAYVVSKAGLEALTRVLAKEYAPRIRINAIAPGLVLPSNEVSQSLWEKMTARLPLGHSVNSDDLSAALEFILDNQSITGQTLVVDGGYSLL
jgi:pteridine reductase